MIDHSASLPFDFRSLEIFLAVCDSGGMAAAARSLRLTQPAVSLSISELERRTGSLLFDRAVRPIALTRAGGLMRQKASALMAEARQLAPQLRDTEQGKVPLIRVGLVESLNRAMSTPLAAFLATRADKVSILSGLTATHASELLTRRLDLFLGVDDLEDMPGLERWEIAKEPYVLLLPRGSAPVRTLTDLRKLARAMPLIRFSARSQTGLDIDRHLRRIGIETPRSFEFDTPYAVASMVATGAGYAITTPLCVFEAMLPKTSVVTSALPGPVVTRTLTIVARHNELGQLPRELATFARQSIARIGT